MAPPRRLTLVLTVALSLALAACAADAPKGAVIAPDLVGKADVATRVTQRGALGWSDAPEATGEFTEDLAYDAWTLAIRPGARLTLEVTPKGSSRTLDTTLFVYGPRDADGGYGAATVAFDDDSGWGRLSRLADLQLAAGGDYLVVVGTADARGRGRYRLVTRCTDEDCAPLAPAVAGACPTPIVTAIRACVDGQRADVDYDPTSTSHLDLPDLIDLCADAEVVAPAWDTLCASVDASAAICDLSLEAFATETLPRCRLEVMHATLDTSCVFGERYRDLWDHPDATVVLWRRTLDSADGLDALEAEQIVRAVRETAYDDVVAVEDAFAAVDQGEVHETAVWDASGRRAFVAYEVGAGDNSFGAFFAHGTVDVVARIGDGDLFDCTPSWGPERRACAADDECGAGLRCEGRPPDFARGRCLAARAIEDPAAGRPCRGVDGCPAGAGLVCAGASYDGVGICQPAWMRARFNATPTLAIPDADPAGVDAQLLAYGLATVDVEVALDLYLTHPRVSDIKRGAAARSPETREVDDAVGRLPRRRVQGRSRYDPFRDPKGPPAPKAAGGACAEGRRRWRN